MISGTFQWKVPEINKLSVRFAALGKTHVMMTRHYNASKLVIISCSNKLFLSATNFRSGRKRFFEDLKTAKGINYPITYQEYHVMNVPKQCFDYEEP